MLYNGLDFRETSCACPEQYDVYDMDSNLVGCVRLRRSHLTAQYPSNDGDLVYEIHFDADDHNDGRFCSESERSKYLSDIAYVIRSNINGFPIRTLMD